MWTPGSRRPPRPPLAARLSGSGTRQARGGLRRRGAARDLGLHPSG